MEGDDRNESLWSWLALVRFILALLVFVSHLLWFGGIPPEMKFLNRFGAGPAVVCFLLISGFSIGHSHREGREGFYERRFLRIYPLYVMAVLFTQLMVCVLGPSLVLPGRDLVASGWKTTVANLFLLQEFIAIPLTFNPPLWSLSVECFYYLLAPLLACWKPGWLIGLITLSVGMFLTAWSPEHFPSELWGHKAVLYAWPWLLGFLFGSLNRRRSAFWLSLAATAVVHFGPFGSEDQYRAITWLGVMGVLFYGGRIELPFWVRRIFNYLGELSFPLYLFHVPFALFFYSLAGIHRPWSMVGCVLGWVAVFNQIFDHWLKSWFWKPLVRWATERFPKRDCQTIR